MSIAFSSFWYGIPGLDLPAVDHARLGGRVRPVPGGGGIRLVPRDLRLRDRHHHPPRSGTRPSGVTAGARIGRSGVRIASRPSLRRSPASHSGRMEHLGVRDDRRGPLRAVGAVRRRPTCHPEPVRRTSSRSSARWGSRCVLSAAAGDRRRVEPRPRHGGAARGRRLDGWTWSRSCRRIGHDGRPRLLPDRSVPLLQHQRDRGPRRHGRPAGASASRSASSSCGPDAAKSSPTSRPSGSDRCDGCTGSPPEAIGVG